MGVGVGGGNNRVVRRNPQTRAIVRRTVTVKTRHVPVETNFPRTTHIRIGKTSGPSENRGRGDGKMVVANQRVSTDVVRRT